MNHKLDAHSSVHYNTKQSVHFTTLSMTITADFDIWQIFFCITEDQAASGVWLGTEMKQQELRWT